MSAGIIFEGATLTLDASSVGCVRGFGVPGDEINEFDKSCLQDLRETWAVGSQKKKQQFVFTLVHDTTEATLLAVGDSGEFVITMPKQESASTVQESFTFTGYVVTTGSIDGAQGDTEAASQEVTVTLTTEVVRVAES